MKEKSYQWNMVDVVRILNEGLCSDDRFYYFRDWLISQGQEIFEKALVDPDSLAKIVEPYVEFEAFGRVAFSVYKKRFSKYIPTNTGSPMEEAYYEMKGEKTDESDYSKSYPKILKCAKEMGLSYEQFPF